MTPQPQIVLITGVTANGIGAALAILLASQPEQFKVYGTLRNIESKSAALFEEAKQLGVDPALLNLVEMHVTSDESCAAAVSHVLDKEGRIDQLINNAGAGLFGNLEGTPIEKAKECMDINYWGPYRMMQLVLPTMRKHRYGRIINVSSVGGIVGQSFNEAYCSAKAALDSLTESMNPPLRSMGINIVSFCPGAVRTDFVANVQKSSSTSAEGSYVHPAYKELADSYLKTVMVRFQSEEGKKASQTPRACALDIEALVKAANPPARFATATTKALVDLKFRDVSGEDNVAFFQKHFFKL